MKTKINNKELRERLRLLKRKAAPINYRALAVNEFGELIESDLDKRIVKGYLVIWGKKNLYGEKFIKGCFAKSIQEHGPGSQSSYKIKFLNQHKQAEACALFSVLKEDDTGLYFETEPLDDVTWADDLLTQLRSGTINNFSIGFDYIWDKIEWDSDDDSLVIIEALLFEGSAVSIPADLGTFAVRGMQDMERLDEEIRKYIQGLPRPYRLQARKLFAFQKSLIDLEPVEKRTKSLQKKKKPTKKGIDFEFLIKNI